MKVGDLVRFKNIVQGMTGLTGVIISRNGDLFRVLWSNTTLGIELPELIEVISESR